MPLCETVVIKELMCFQQHQNDSNFVWLEALSLPDKEYHHHLNTYSCFRKFIATFHSVVITAYELKRMGYVLERLDLQDKSLS